MGRRLAAANEEHRAETERYRAEAEAYRLAAEPRNMGLKKMLRALPRVMVDALKRRGRRYFLRG
jgi:hypothetical protein